MLDNVVGLFPIPREERGKIGDWMIGNPGEHVGEPGLGIDIIELGGIHLAKTTGMMLGSYGKEFRLLPQACFSCGLASSSTVAIHRSVSRDDREG